MCLDGDSILGAGRSGSKSVAYFADERVVATASNVNILPDGTCWGSSSASSTWSATT